MPEHLLKSLALDVCVGLCNLGGKKKLFNILSCHSKYCRNYSHDSTNLCSMIDSLCADFHSSTIDSLDSLAISIAITRNLSLCTVF